MMKSWALRLLLCRLCALRYSRALARSLLFRGMAANKVTAAHLGLLTALAKPDTKPSRRRAFGGFFPRAAQQPHKVQWPKSLCRVLGGIDATYVVS